MRKIIAWILLAAVCCLLPRTAEAADVLGLASETAVLIDADTGQILYGKNANQPMYPASITKVMTGMLALQNLEPGQLLTVSQAAYNSVPRTSSHISLEPGETLTVDQAMYALAMESANDAANVLGEAISGSQAAFAQKMTETAHALGAYDTNFTNANGLPDSNHYTTAYDMAMIAAAALNTPGFTDYFSTRDYTMAATNLSAPRYFSNANRMFGQYAMEGVLMSKTGWTSAAQGTLVTAARQGDTTLIAVVMKSILLEDKYRDTTKLFQYGFYHHVPKDMTGEELASRLNLEDFTAAPGQTFTYLLPAEVEPAQVSFSLSGDTRLPDNDNEANVNVLAALGDMVLPDVTLKIERMNSDTPAPVFVYTEDEPTPIQEPEQDFSAVAFPAMAAAAVFSFFLVRRLHSNDVRRQRRRDLDARIRQMKKKSR